MLNIRIVCVGKLKESFYAEAGNEYLKRLSGYCKAEVVEVPEHRLPAGLANCAGMETGPSATETHDANSAGYRAQVALALEKELAAIEKKIPPRAATVALCAEGRQMDSRGLSEYLMATAGRGASQFCFIIGGSFGLHKQIKDEADIMLSLSKMTFPRNLARVILLEQLYRALNIAGGGKYHK